jgi:FtsP/CotA-like multicopper oxidase with cupredoxin domain
MGAAGRIALVAIAAVAAVGLFLALRPPTEPAPQRQASESRPTTTADGGPTDAGERGGDARDAERRPRPSYRRIRVRDGAPVGGVKTLRVKSGDTARIAVTADAPDELHLHGYDITADVGPGRTARMRFKADLEGVFELELHGNGALLANLRVEP